MNEYIQSEGENILGMLHVEMDHATLLQALHEGDFGQTKKG